MCNLRVIGIIKNEGTLRIVEPENNVVRLIKLNKQIQLFRTLNQTLPN